MRLKQFRARASQGSFPLLSARPKQAAKVRSGDRRRRSKSTMENASALSDHRRLAIDFNRRVWELFDNKARSPADADEMVVAAYASLAHWMKAGTGVRAQRGEWLIARVVYQPGDEVALGSFCVGCDDGDEHGGFAVGRGDHYDGHHAFGLNGE